MRVSTLMLALVIVVSAAACSRSDADVQSDVQKQLAADSTTAGLTVSVIQGVARISGVTQSKAQQDRASDIARAVKGVKVVESDMRIDDTALTDAVRKAIAADASLSDIPLRVEAHNGEVKLFSDKTNADQRAKLVEVTGAVYGVTHVEDDMK